VNYISNHDDWKNYAFYSDKWYSRNLINRLVDEELLEVCFFVIWFVITLASFFFFFWFSFTIQKRGVRVDITVLGARAENVLSQPSFELLAFGSRCKCVFFALINRESQVSPTRITHT